MTRIVWDKGHHIFYDDGDGVGGSSKTIGSVQGRFASEEGRVKIWKAPSGDGTTNVDGTFAVGDTVMTQFDDPNIDKVHEMTYQGTFSYTDQATSVTYEFIVLHNTTSYGGSFLLVGPSLPTKAIFDALVADFNSEEDITAVSYTVCFFPGTLIATPSGERRVEDLVRGDLVLVDDADGKVPASWFGRLARQLRRSVGHARVAPVKWIGRQTVSTLFGPADRLMPVRFAAGSLGGGGATPTSA